MFAHDRRALSEISAILRREFPPDIEGIYVFGSHARGDNDEGSDFDVLIVVRGKTPKKEERIIGVLVDEESSRGLFLAPLIKDSGSFALERAHNSPFYQNIVAEGIPI